jgi:hypothetical protein
MILMATNIDLTHPYSNCNIVAFTETYEHVTIE